MGSSATKEKLQLASKTKQLNLDNSDIENYEKWEKILSKNVADVRSLSLCENKLGGAIPRTFFQPLTFLKTLRLDKNQITDINVVFTSLPKLEVFHAANNKISQPLNLSLLPETITELNLTGNCIPSIIITAAATTTPTKQLKKLRVVKLGQNKLSHICPEFPTLLCSLEELDLSRNTTLAALPEAGWHLCVELRLVDLSYNQSLNGVPGSLLGAPKVHNINVDGIRSDSSFLDEMKKLPEYAVYEKRRERVVNKGLQGG
eukprot:PhF_6_TR9108/c0_g1_i1/m.14179